MIASDTFREKRPVILWSLMLLNNQMDLSPTHAASGPKAPQEGLAAHVERCALSLVLGVALDHLESDFRGVDRKFSLDA
jgi:hypothetical protein